MKKFNAFLLCGTMALASGSLMAQDYGRDQNHGDHGDHGDHGNHGGHDDRNDNDNDYGHGHGHDRNDRHEQGMYDRGRHEGWYKRGGRVPYDYRGENYVVSDWRGSHLRQPPRGYDWVRSDNGDYLLIAVSTGIIESILAH